jgi:predicted DsbA family dithiol-disulfide isomerase
MKIEVFSDLVCPWCFIGKRRLDAVLASPAGEGIDVVWRAYQLYPGIPEEGMPRDEFMKLRFGRSGPASGRSRIEEEARGAGIDMDFRRIERMPNTFKGHRLLHHARSAGVQHELADTLFRAYFEEGRDVGDDDVLIDAAAACGMDRQGTREFLAGDSSTDAVNDELSRAANVGVTGVPCFILAGAFAIPGAQEETVMRQFIERAREKLAASA